MRPKPASRESDSGLRFLEEKLSVYVQGPAQTRRNPALDLLTGRVPDYRLQAPQPASAQAGAAALLAPAAPELAPEPVAPPGNGHLAPAPVTDGAAVSARTAAAATPTLVLPVPAISITAPPPGTRAAPSPWLKPSQQTTPRIRLVPAAPPPRRGWRSMRLGPVAAAMLMLGAGVSVRVVHDRFLSTPASAESVAAAETVAQPTPAATDTLAFAAPAAAQQTESEAVPVPAPTAAATLSEPTLSLPSPVPADQFRTLLDERFQTNSRGWPTDPQGTAWLANGGLTLFARKPTQFVAVRIPGTDGLGDVVLSASFHKIGGPTGGGYGLILRDQGPGPRDGVNQTGRFYVFEIGDKGELGVWLRDFDRWVDLLTWTPSDVVRPGTATNELTVSAIGDRLSFMVNGEPVASQLDTVLHRGAAGIFTGGDGNQVVLNRVIVRVPR